MAASKQPSTSTVVVGFPSGVTVTGVVKEGLDFTSERDIEDVRNEDNDVDTQVISNKVAIRKVTGHCLSTLTIPDKGDVITIDGVKYLIHDISVSYSRTIARFSLDARKPSAITYT
jgi:hypothetical protein